MSELDIVLITGGIVFFVFLLVCIIALVNKLNTLSRYVTANEKLIWESNRQITNLQFDTVMVDKVPIKHILWDLIGKCGYRIETNLKKFELKLIKKGDQGSYGKEREKTECSRSKEKES